jgi:hypothetical protein
MPTTNAFEHLFYFYLFKHVVNSSGYKLSNGKISEINCKGYGGTIPSISIEEQGIARRIVGISTEIRPDTS